MNTRVFIAVLLCLRDKESLYSIKWLIYHDRVMNFKFRF